MESQTKKNIYVNFSNRYMIGPLQLRVTILSFFLGGGGGFKKWGILLNGKRRKKKKKKIFEIFYKN